MIDPKVIRIMAPLIGMNYISVESGARPDSFGLSCIMPVRNGGKSSARILSHRDEAAENPARVAYALRVSPPDDFKFNVVILVDLELLVGMFSVANGIPILKRQAEHVIFGAVRIRQGVRQGVQMREAEKFHFGMVAAGGADAPLALGISHRIPNGKGRFRPCGCWR